jgi:hypothetical protein
MKRFCNTCTLLMVFFLAASCTAQEIEIENVPDEALTDIELGAFGQTYVLNGAMNPFYLRGDFDGDGKPDYAFWIKTKATGEVGIAVWLTSQRKLVVLGAGKLFNIAGANETNLNFLNTWKVFGKKPVERGVGAGPPPKLVGDAILAGKQESASGLIYWNGKSFAWYQQGD